MRDQGHPLKGLFRTIKHLFFCSLLPFINVISAKRCFIPPPPFCSLPRLHRSALLTSPCAISALSRDGTVETACPRGGPPGCSCSRAASVSCTCCVCVGGGGRRGGVRGEHEGLWLHTDRHFGNWAKVSSKVCLECFAQRHFHNLPEWELTVTVIFRVYQRALTPRPVHECQGWWRSLLSKTVSFIGHTFNAGSPDGSKAQTESLLSVGCVIICKVRQTERDDDAVMMMTRRYNGGLAGGQKVSCW